MLARVNGAPGKYQAAATLVLAVSLAVAAFSLSLGRLSSLPLPGGTPRLAHDLGNFPLQFEPNAGQADTAVSFVAHATGGVMYFTRSGVALGLRQTIDDGRWAMGTGESVSSPASSVVHRPSSAEGVVRLRFLGANPEPEMKSGGILPGKVNYLLGSDPANWHTGLPTYAGITYEELYPGIDLTYSGSGSTLKG